jgi:hypothetical protein
MYHPNILLKTFSIGYCNLPPHKGEGIRRLLHGDIINFVNVDTPENQQVPLDHFQEFIVAQGVEFVYVFSRCLLSIRVCYSKCNAEHNIVQRTLGFIRDLIQPLPNVPSRQTGRHILVGTIGGSNSM